jgi:hypothetical protein
MCYKFLHEKISSISPSFLKVPLCDKNDDELRFWVVKKVKVRYEFILVLNLGEDDQNQILGISKIRI